MAVVSTSPHPAARPRRVTILGATGSVGCNTIDLIARDPEAFEIEALTANRSVAQLAEQARRLRAKRAVIADDSPSPCSTTASRCSVPGRTRTVTLPRSLAGRTR